MSIRTIRTRAYMQRWNTAPVFAAAVILPIGFKSELINDSKKLTAKQREEAFDIITKNAIDYAICSIDSDTIDEVNILNASRMAMQNAIAKLKTISG